MSTVTLPQMPSWLTRTIRSDFSLAPVTTLLRDLQLNTVCQSADCPNIGECFNCGTATFMILGSVCSRRCRFCAVSKGKPQPLDASEPERIVAAVKHLGLSYAVITSVTRDDLPDGGAGQFAACITALKQALPAVKVEVLIPDLQGDAASLQTVLDAGPDVLNHNVETIPRLYREIRPQALYNRSLEVLERAASQGFMAKSGIMVGLGEKPEEVHAVFTDLAQSGVGMVTIGQYLPPDRHAAPLKEYVTPQQFEAYAQSARDAGIDNVFSGPLVRSSYRAATLLEKKKLA